jgi:glycine cleavage system H protein
MKALRYSEEHEWVGVDGDVATVGITNFAQEQLGDLVFVELPKVGAEVSAGEQVAVVESVKAASEVYTPVSGEIVEVNETVVEEPGGVNGDAEGDGWLFKIKLSDPSELDELMDAKAYAAFIKD